MSFFNFFSGFSKEERQQKDTAIGVNWLTLNDLKVLEGFLEISKLKPVLIYKHSTQCGVSSMAKRKIEREWPFKNEEVLIYYLDLIAFRNVSNEIERKFKVQHQSPQLIALFRGRVEYHNSHNSINLDDLSKIITDLK